MVKNFIRRYNKFYKIDMKGERGSYLIEAAVILPILLISLLILIALMRQYEIGWRVSNVIKDEVGIAAGRCYVLPMDLGIRSRVEKRIKENKAVHLKKQNIRYRCEVGMFDNLIACELAYYISFRLPIDHMGDEKRERAVGRGFIGDKKDKSPFSFEKMEKDDERHIVCIFKIDGERYHKENCHIVEPKCKEVLFDRNIEKDYARCDICIKKDVSYGEKVFIFSSYGRVYHMNNCRAVYKNFEKISRQKAEDRGYSSCKICRP